MEYKQYFHNNSSINRNIIFGIQVVKMKLLKEFMMGVVEGMKQFGKLISTLINSLLMLTVYFLLVGPTAILAKIAGKQSIELKNIGWNKIHKRDKDSHYKQF